MCACLTGRVLFFCSALYPAFTPSYLGLFIGAAVFSFPANCTHKRCLICILNSLTAPRKAQRPGSDSQIAPLHFFHKHSTARVVIVSGCLRPSCDDVTTTNHAPIPSKTPGRQAKVSQTETLEFDKQTRTEFRFRINSLQGFEF